MEQRYPQILKFVSETPWAILPSKLVEIREMFWRKVNGIELTQEQIEAITAAAQRPKVPSQGKVAVIPISGVIAPHADLMTEMSGGTSIDGFLSNFRMAMADPSVSSIVLDIESPGGSVELIQEAGDEIRAARSKKNVVAVANAFAASAAYWLMSQASEAVVTPSGQVGSIGAVAIHQDVSQALADEGIKPTIITSSPYKAESSPFAPLSDEAKQALQENVDAYGAAFIQAVAKGRGVSASTVEKTYGQGRMVRAEPALAAGMVDRIASFDQVISGLLGGKPTKTRSIGASDGSATLDVAASTAPGKTPGLQEFAKAFALALNPIAPVGAGAFGEDPRSSDASTVTTIDNPQEENTVGREEMLARLEAIAERQKELDALYTGKKMEGEDLAEWNALVDESNELKTIIEQMEARSRSLITQKVNEGSVASGDGAHVSFHTNTDSRKSIPDNIYNVGAYRNYVKSVDELPKLWREGAKRANEALVYETEEQDKVKSHVEKLLSKDSSVLPSESFAHRLLVTSDPAYDKAFGKLITGGNLSSHERQLIDAAISHTGLGSETPVPVTIDPTVLLTSDGVVNPLRQIADVRTITGLKWQGITSDGISVEYDAELAEVDPVDPSFDAPNGSVAKAQAEIQLSLEIDADWPNLRTELAAMLADAKDAKEAEKFLFGSGTDEPYGLIQALLDDGSVTTTTETMNTFALEDLFTLRKDLPPRFRARASYLANDVVYSEVRQFGAEDAVGPNLFWVDMSGDNPARLLGKPAYEASEMSDDVDSGGEDIMVYGDFGRGFVIIDRVGLNVINAGLVRTAAGKLNGSTAIYAYWRNTSVLRTAKAFRLLEVSSS